jgi:hypothetical protein
VKQEQIAPEEMRIKMLPVPARRKNIASKELYVCVRVCVCVCVCACARARAHICVCMCMSLYTLFKRDISSGNFP